MKKILLSVLFACVAIVGFAQAPIMSQGFDGVTVPGMPTGWTNVHTGGGNGWVTATAQTDLYFGTIPNTGTHTAYAVVNEYGFPKNTPATMTTTNFNLTGVTTPYLVYDYMYWEAYLNASPYTHEAAWIEFSSNGGGSWAFLDSIPAFTVSGQSWTTRFIPLPVSSSSTCQLRFVYNDHGANLIGVAVDNILVYGAVSTDIGLSSVSPAPGSATAYAATGGGITFSGVATNYGSTTISSFTATYKVGTGTAVTAPIAVSIPPYSSAPFSFPAPYTVAGMGDLSVKIWVTTTGETYMNNDTMSTVITGVPFMPKKRVFFEEATGTWCGWCVRGIVYMDSLWRADSSNVAIISVHNGDPMQSDNASSASYDVMAGKLVSGYPSMIIDRHIVDDPSGAFDDYDANKDLFGYANMGLTTTTAAGAVTAHVKVEPAINMTGDYRLELIVTEEEVTGVGGTWDQHNYYAVGGSGHSIILHTIGYDFNNLPSSIPGVKFPFVARYTIPTDLGTTASQNGVSGSLPSFMHFGHEYTYDFAPVTIASNWNASKLRYTVAMIDNNAANATFGYVLNSVTTSSKPGYSFITVSFVGVAEVNGGISEVTVYPNPATDEAHVRFQLKEATTVKFTIYDAVGREVFGVPAEKMNAGGQQLNFSTENLPSGIYNVVISTEGGKVSQRLSIVK
jgi:Secretion system C-terminal sorting domain